MALRAKLTLVCSTLCARQQQMVSGTQFRLHRSLRLSSFSPDARQTSCTDSVLVALLGYSGSAKNYGRPWRAARTDLRYVLASKHSGAVGNPGLRYCKCCAVHTSSGVDCDESSAKSLLEEIPPMTGLISPPLDDPGLSQPAPKVSSQGGKRSRQKRMCYYFSQGLCKMMENEAHMLDFSHEYPNLSVRAEDPEKVKPQPFDYLLVLDLEGMVEILEFPIVLLDARSLRVVDRFHRFVRPCRMGKERLDDYIRNKYGKWGLARVWHDTAIPFTDVLQTFEGWLEEHELLNRDDPARLNRAAFVTCGNWDVKTKIPEQCVTSGIPLPLYFNEWINLKDIYFNFYKFRASGMLPMMKGLKIPMEGTHHVGLDDAHNITRVLQRMLAHGVVMKTTATRKPGGDPKDVKFAFRFRIK